MIVNNEEALLGNFLEKIKDFVDEIIIVDTGSRDRTKEIAGRFTEKVFEFEWKDDFSEARNLSIEKAKKDWILVLDPDEELQKEDSEKIRKIAAEGKKEIMGYRLIQHTFHKDKLISIRGICRLFRNDKEIKFIYPVHETVRESIKGLGGKIGKTGIIIRHFPEISKEKQDYYLKLLKKKKTEFPESSVDKEIENEHRLFNPR